MTNTHRKTTNRTTAKIAAVGAFGIGAAIAFPGLAAAEDAGTPTDPTASLAEATGEDGSLEGALGTDIGVDLGSLSFNLNLDAETPNPGSIEFGSLGVSPNTGSDAIDGGGPAADPAPPARPMTPPPRRPPPRRPPPVRSARVTRPRTTPRPPTTRPRPAR